VQASGQFEVALLRLTRPFADLDRRVYVINMPNALYLASAWIIPIILAITLHEAAHAFVARFLGDDTASQLRRVSLNPFKHIDPVGTILLPGFLLLARSPFVFGYAKSTKLTIEDVCSLVRYGGLSGHHLLNTSSSACDP
jgi:hypothetical protein